MHRGGSSRRITGWRSTCDTPCSGARAVRDAESPWDSVCRTLLSVVTRRQQQGRNLLAYLTACYRALCRFHEIVGGTPIISPREKDLQNPELAPYLEKYLKGVDVDARRRLQVIRFARELGVGYGAGRMQIFNHHADAPRDSFKKQTVVYFEELGEAKECIDSVESLLNEANPVDR